MKGKASSFLSTGLGVLAILATLTAAAEGETLTYLPAKDLSRFNVSLGGGGNRPNPAGVFDLDEAGTLKVSGSRSGFLVTKRQFKDYALTVEYRWTTSNPDRDSGVFVNTVKARGKYTGLECDLPKPGVELSGKLWLFGRGTKGITVDGRRITQGKAAPELAIPWKNR